MKVQSLSIVIPGGCPNNCHFCISKTRKEQYSNFIKEGLSPLSKKAYLTRLKFVKNLGTDNVIFTGIGEPLSNISLVKLVSFWMDEIRGFNYREIQTSGVSLDSYKIDRLKYANISTISLSLSSLITKENIEINRIKREYQFDIEKLCHYIKDEGFNLRISLNMNSVFNGINPYDIFNKLNDLGADQVTFRELYAPEGTYQYNWIQNNNYTYFEALNNYIKEFGNPLEKLSYGLQKYSVHGMSTVIDNDCMSKKSQDLESYKYLILRPDCRLYSRWDDRGSLIF